jgi:glucokinase
MEPAFKKKCVIGVDISLEATTYALVDVRGNIIVKDSFPTEDYPTVNGFVSMLGNCIRHMIDENISEVYVRAVGISASSANYLTGCIENSPNLPWKGVVPLAALLRDFLGLAVVVANDAHVVALSEYAYGVAHGMRDFVVIKLGTGVGSCAFSNGQPHVGYGGYAGELGHACVQHGGRLCGCGNRGCLEAYVGPKGIIQTAHEVLAESDMASLMRGVEHLTPRLISSFCDENDALAIEVFRRTGFMLGLGLANYASVVNPEAFVFTGGIAKAGDWLLDPMQETFEKYVYKNMQGKTKFLVSELDEDNHDVLGASVLAWEVKEYSLFK